MRNLIILILMLSVIATGAFAQDDEIDISGQDVDYIVLNIPCENDKQCFDAITNRGGRGELARCNEVYQKCEYPQAKDTGFNLSWQLVVLICVCLVFMGFLIFLEYQKPKPKKRFSNPFMVTIIAGVFLSFIIFVMEAVGVLPANWSREHWWIFPCLFVGVYLAAVTYLKIIKPLSHDQLKEKTVERLWKDFDAKPYDGPGFDSPIVAMEYSDTNEDNKMLNKVVNFLILGESTVVRLYLMTLSILDGEIRRELVNPTKDQIRKIFSKEIVATIDLEKTMAVQGFLEDMNGQEQPPQRPPATEN